MDAQSLRCLINSISRFILLVSCQSMKSALIQKDFESMAGLMKRLKPLLDEIADDERMTDEILLRVCENLDVAVNEARDFLERWCSKISKIFTVWQSELLLSTIRSSSLEICRILCRLLRASPSSSSVAGVQNCMQELQLWKANQLSNLVEQVLRGEKNKLIFSSKNLSEVIDLVGLTSNHELLRESIAAEKQRMRCQASDIKAELEQIDRILELLSFIREHMLKSGYFDAPNSVPIPSYFRCPLSLEIMVDPVIVASGQTFERASIQKWLDHGLTICPKTRQSLSHINIISNYTIKALIANWFEEKNLKYPTTGSTPTPARSPSNIGPSQDVIHTDCFVGSLHGSNSTSRSSQELGDMYASQKFENEPYLSQGGEETSECQGKEEIEKTARNHRSSPEHSYVHSRTHSVSSAISSNDYIPSVTEIVRISSKLETVMGQFSSETRTECCSSLPNTSLSGKGSYSYSSKSISEISASQTDSYPARALSFPSSDAGPNGSIYCVQKLIEGLKSKSTEAQTRAASELRSLTKNNMEYRVIAGKSGAVRPLVSLLYSNSKPIQEHAVTALLNLSINENNRMLIAEAGVIEPIIHVLRSGNDAAKENSAATLFSLSGLADQKVKIGRSGAVKALVSLLSSGTLRGKKDAAAALFNLSICHENRARIVQAGAVKFLVDLLDLDSGLVDKAVALLANMSTVSEGRLAISRAGGIPLIVEILENGSQRGMENAASILLQLCLNSNKFCAMVLQEGAVPPLVALSQSGSPRAKEKAQQLLSHFRSQREGATGKKRSPRLLG